MSDLVDTMVRALGAQLHESLSRDHPFPLFTIQDGVNSVSAELRLEYPAIRGESNQMGHQIGSRAAPDDSRNAIVLRLVQPRAGTIHRQNAVPDGCVVLCLELNFQQRCIKTHGRQFELNHPNMFDQMLQWSRSMLGRYVREMREKLAGLRKESALDTAQP